MIAELQVVELLREAGYSVIVPAGTQGTVVHIWGNGKSYSVEFAEPNACVLALEASDFRVLP